MPIKTRQTVFAVLYCLLLSRIYLTEIVDFWRYMGFNSEYSSWGLVLSLSVSAGIAALTPDDQDLRSLILSSALYIFFIPMIIYISYSPVQIDYYFAYIVVVTSIFIFSKLRIEVAGPFKLSPESMLKFVFGAIIAALAVQAAFGGLANFNLDIERVYEFRRDAASDLPAIFGYLYSNVASVLVPLALVLALKSNRYWLAALSLVSSVILFGMSHHKSVLFGPPTVAILYFFFQRTKHSYMIGAVMLAIPIIGLIELAILRNIIHSGEAAYLNSLIVRRVIFVPSMLDGLYVDYFGVNAKYYWSTSRIGSWASENSYSVTAPFVIGHEYFYDMDTSANTGVIGSGYANAGLFGVAIYSAAMGLLIALLNGYGRRIGHPFVAAASFATVFNILTSTDLITAVLTHGLLLLVVLLALFPADEDAAPSFKVQPA